MKVYGDQMATSVDRLVAIKLYRWWAWIDPIPPRLNRRDPRSVTIEILVQTKGDQLAKSFKSSLMWCRSLPMKGNFISKLFEAGRAYITMLPESAQSTACTHMGRASLWAAGPLIKWHIFDNYLGPVKWRLVTGIDHMKTDWRHTGIDSAFVIFGTATKHFKGAIADKTLMT